ncbi:MAG: hypothetical protein IJ307_00955 [Bacteroidales bacterium]|nr:hypothetical protein [Bacteroidales bacterium]
MKDKEFKRHMAYEALVLLGLLALLTYITRLWPILLLIILGIFIATLRLLFLSSKKVEPLEPVLALPEPAAPPEPREQDFQSMAMVVIQRRISQILEAKYPNVRWVWENPRAREDIMAGNKVYVILNRAGGYRRGLVLIRNLQVFDVIFENPEQNSDTVSQPPVPPAPPKPDPEPVEDDEDEEIPEDFGLIAFQWVEANIVSLNEKCNEAIGQGANSYLIPAEDLPVPDSWLDICKELEHNDLPGAFCCEGGIKIEFEQ